jgi:L-rhamnose-H+ transport protein
MWGFGGLMCGLSLRFAGLSLGQSISLGVCAIVGTIVPAIMDNKVKALVSTQGGHEVLLGFAICLLGIYFCGLAGFRKERQLTDEQKKEAVQDFALVKGLVLAVCGGIMSASMALALKFGAPIAELSVQAGTSGVFKNNIILIPALAGGFTTNFFSAMILTTKNKAFGDYTLRPRSTLLLNYFLSIISGMMWYGQYFFYGMGTTKMGKFDFASWSIHMATIIIFSNLWGLWLKEWALVDRRGRTYLWIGIFALVASVIMIGLGNYHANPVEV